MEGRDAMVKYIVIFFEPCMSGGFPGQDLSDNSELVRATISLPKSKNRFVTFREYMHFHLYNFQQDSVMLYCLTGFLNFALEIIE